VFQLSKRKVCEIYDRQADIPDKYHKNDAFPLVFDNMRKQMNVIGRLLRDRAMLAQTSDRSTAQRDPPIAQIRL